MTQAETSRGRGRPKTYDELELMPRIRSIEDLARIEANLVANGETKGTARGASAWLGAIKTGDPTGGVSTESRARFRHMLARLKHDPLGTPPKRRRTAARQRGAADVVYVSAAAGAMALASSPAVNLVVTALAHRPPIMLRTVMSPAELELAA